MTSTAPKNVSFNASQATSPLLPPPPESSSDRRTIEDRPSGITPTPTTTTATTSEAKAKAKTKSKSKSKSKPYRPARQIPFELGKHAQTYFEEGLFTGGLSFLLAISSAVSDNDNDNDNDDDDDMVQPMIVAPPAILALAATIAVHPVFTSRVDPTGAGGGGGGGGGGGRRDKWEQAHAALRLLRVSVAGVGPVGARLADAFAFRKYGMYEDADAEDGDYYDGGGGGDERGGGGGYGERSTRGSGAGGAGRRRAGAGGGAVRSRFAQGDSVWTRAEDFWQVVGWALNCSCLSGRYRERWKWWQPWLEFMLDALEADWELHYHGEAEEEEEKDDEDDDEDDNDNEELAVEESMIWQYIELSKGGYARSRRMMRAIFADGSQKSLNEFGEVFRNELKAPLPAGKQRTKNGTRDVQKVDVDRDVYGDYLFDSSDDDDEDDDNDEDGDGGGTLGRSRLSRQGSNSKSKSTRAPRPRRAANSRASSRSSRSSIDRDDSGAGGGSWTRAGHLRLSECPPGSLQLRMRLLHLLSHVSRVATQTSSAPSTFIDLDELYGHFVEWIKPLPLDVFQQMISASTGASRRFGIDAHTTLCEMALQWMLESAAPKVRAERFLTRDKLVKQYLPFAAGAADVTEQAKVGICLETMLRRAVEVGLVGPGDVEDVRAAVQQGAERRAGYARVVMAKEKKRTKRMKTGKRRKRAKGEAEEEAGDDEPDVRRSEGEMEDNEDNEEAIQEQEAWAWLKEGEARMRAVVDLIA